MSKRYIATVMNKHYVGEDSFIFTSSHAIIGEIIENNIFRDRNGNEYAPMLEAGVINSSIPYSYFNQMEINDLGKVVVKNLPLKEKISEYEYLTKKMFYYVGLIEGEKPICIPFKLDELNKIPEDSIKEEYNSNPVIDSVEVTTGEEDDEREYQLEELVIDVVKGKYSLKELRELRDELSRNQEDIESALDTITIQLEASKKGNASVPLKESSEEIPIKRQNIKDGIDIEELYEKVTRTLIAQDEAARRVIVEIARKLESPKKKKDGILLTGSTGVGKTKLIDLIAKYINKPFLKVNSTTLTTSGYTGKDIEEVLWDLYLKCDSDIKKTEQAIIFFDEIDKKGSKNKSDHSGQGILNALLPFIEGTTYDACEDTKTSTNRVKIDTSNMIIILGGAFNDVYKDLTEKGEIGFERKIGEQVREAKVDDFVEKAMMPDEFMGRVAIIKLKDLNVEELKRVMLESDESAIKEQQKLFENLGIKLTFTDEYTTSIAESAVERKTGARGLNQIIDDSTWQAFEEVYKKSNRGLYSEVILNAETAKDPSKYQLIKRHEKIKR